MEVDCIDHIGWCTIQDVLYRSQFLIQMYLVLIVNAHSICISLLLSFWSFGAERKEPKTLFLYVAQDLPELEQIFSRHARMLLEEASPLIIERKPDYRTRVDHKGQMRAISDRTRVIAIACVVLVLVALTMCCCLKRKKADRKESSSGLSEAFPCGTSEANSDTWLVKNESDKFDMVDRLHSWGDVSTPAFRTRGDVRRSDDFVILVSILAPPNTSPRPLMQ